MYKKEKFDLLAFGRIVRSVREGMGLSREEVAEIFELSSRHIQYLETRGQSLSLQKFYEIGKYFNISIDNLFYERESESKGTHRRQLDAILDSLHENDIEMLAAIIKGFLAIRKKQTNK